jgi:trans-aconitate methyltransferase
LYAELAGWWQLISPTEDYADEAAFFGRLFLAENAGTVLELGCGGGNVAWFLKEDFVLTLTDISEAMLAESKKQNPELEHIEGDMRTLRLERTFDGILIHDAIMYMSSEEDLRAALLTAHEHCKPGGVSVFVPDWVDETFQPKTTHEGVDREAVATRSGSPVRQEPRHPPRRLSRYSQRRSRGRSGPARHPRQQCPGRQPQAIPRPCG